MAYKTFKAVDEMDRRIYMAGLSLTQLVGFKSAREFCKHTTLLVADIDTDEMLFFSNTIDQDEKHALEGNTTRYSSYFAATIPAYVHPDHQAEAEAFFDARHLRSSFNRGQMTDSLEYPCVLEDGLMHLRACYSLEQSEDDGHVLATIVLIDITRLRQEDEG